MHVISVQGSWNWTLRFIDLMYMNSFSLAIDEQIQMKQAYNVNWKRDQVHYDFDLIFKIVSGEIFVFCYRLFSN